MSAKERVLAVYPNAIWHQPMDSNAGAIFRDGLETYGATHLSRWLPKEEAAWKDAASRLPSPHVEGTTQTAVELLARYLEAKEWSMWDQSDPELNRLREIEQKVYDEHRNHGFTEARIKAYEAVILAALRDDNKEAKHG